MAMGMGIVNGGIGKNGNENKMLSWEWVGMGMTSWEWEGMGTAKVIPAHRYSCPLSPSLTSLSPFSFLGTLLNSVRALRLLSDVILS